ncbi:MAG: helix-turn-helix domain-containing protein, partial [Pseudomonadota bacterium]
MSGAPSAAKPVKYSAPALSKGLDIIELLASEPIGMRKSEIARALDRSVSEIFRMLVVLEERGYVAQTRTEQYALTTKLFEVAHRHPPIRRLSLVAGDVMRDIAHSTNQSVHLGVLHGVDVLIIAQVDAPGNHVHSVRLGARIPLLQTASGVVLVHTMPQEDREALIAECD